MHTYSALNLLVYITFWNSATNIAIELWPDSIFILLWPGSNPY